MEVEIISKEFIQPSSPTPPNLRIHKLSMFDQFAVPVHVPMVLYYNPIHPNNLDKKLQLLKQSLSQTLTRFYPLAGVVKDELSIDCNDEGVSYVEARVRANLHDFLDKPNLPLIHHFLPTIESSAGAKVALVQITMFECGGIAIGVYILHTVFDGLGMITFLKDWGANARGCCDGTVSPDFTTAPTRFPQIVSFPKEFSLMAMSFFKTGKCVTRRFVFDASALAKLKVKSTNAHVKISTRVEVVVALIWKCVMAAIKSNSGVPKPSIVSHVVNLRYREKPPLSEYLLGNLISAAHVECTGETDTDTDTYTELGNLVVKLKEGVTKLDSGFLKKREGEQGRHNYLEGLKREGEVFSNASNKGAEFFIFSSWCRFGFYEVDFGWGEPIWASHTGSSGVETSKFNNLICLMDNKLGDAIEAWVTLDEQDMVVLECDEEFLEFTSLNPSPLNVDHLA